MALLNTFLKNKVTIECEVFDYEKGWSSCIDSLQLKLCNSEYQQIFGRNQVSFHYGDLTQPFKSNSNHKLANFCKSVDLFVFLYVCVENRKILEASDFVFFKELFSEAPKDSVFLFMDSSHRLWLPIKQLAGEHFECSFPYCRISRNAMFLRKKC